jgi:hypothetical protein
MSIEIRQNLLLTTDFAVRFAVDVDREKALEYLAYTLAKLKE